MKIVPIKLNMPADVVAGCMDFSNESRIDVAISNTLVAFVNLMKARGKIPERTVEEADQMVSLHTRPDDDADMFEDIDSFLPTKRDPTIEEIAHAVQSRIEKASTPRVRTNEDQTIRDKVPIEDVKFNLLEIDRKRLVDLAKIAPKDRFIEQALEVERKLKLGVEIAISDVFFIPALEIAYSNLGPSEWGTDYALVHITNLIKAHDGSIK